MSTMQVPTEASRLAALAAETVREVLGPGMRVRWYGSWARGTAVPRSDVDLAIVTDSTIPPAVMAGPRERIDDLPTVRKIDLVDANAVGDALRARILSEDIGKAGVPRPCVVRVKLFTLDNPLLLRRAGRLADADSSRVERSLASCLPRRIR